MGASVIISRVKFYNGTRRAIYSFILSRFHAKMYLIKIFFNGGAFGNLSSKHVKIFCNVAKSGAKIYRVKYSNINTHIILLHDTLFTNSSFYILLGAVKSARRRGLPNKIFITGLRQ